MGEHVRILVKKVLPGGGYRVLVGEGGRLRDVEVERVTINRRAVETASLEIDADDYRLSEDGDWLDITVTAAR